MRRLPEARRRPSRRPGGPAPRRTQSCGRDSSTPRETALGIFGETEDSRTDRKDSVSLEHLTVLENQKLLTKTKICRDFPGHPVVKTLSSNVGGVGFLPGQTAKIPHPSQSQKPEHEQ